MAAALKAQESTPAPTGVEGLLTLREVQTQFRVGRTWLDAHGVPHVIAGRGNRRMYDARDVEAARSASTVQPKLPRKAEVTSNADELDALLASGDLVRR
jgi:hypothetical protein